MSAYWATAVIPHNVQTASSAMAYSRTLSIAASLIIGNGVYPNADPQIRSRIGRLSFLGDILEQSEALRLSSKQTQPKVKPSRRFLPPPGLARERGQVIRYAGAPSETAPSDPGKLVPRVSSHPLTSSHSNCCVRNPSGECYARDQMAS